MNMNVQIEAPAPAPSCWYLLDVYPGRERDVLRWFGYHGLSGWYPLEAKHVKRSNGAPARKPHLGRRTFVPLIPGLIFVADVHADPRMLSFPHVDGIHRIGDCTARMSVDDMARLRDIEAYLNAPRIGRGKRAPLKVGDAVRIMEGPFSDFVGQIERLDSRGRLKVFIDAITRGASVTIDEAQVEQVPIPPSRPGLFDSRSSHLRRST